MPRYKQIGRVSALRCHRPPASIAFCSRRRPFCLVQAGQRRDPRPELPGIWRVSASSSVIEQVLADRRRVTGGDPLRLEHFGFKVYSQSDEDGIIAEIFRRIGVTNRVFVEFGAETGMENNSRLLLEQGWTGLWIEGNPDYAGAINWRYHDELANGRLKFIERYVDRENINDLIRSAGLSGKIDFLSIDIDSNDYHVFETIEAIQPRVVCLEHNHEFPPPAEWVMPYNPAYRWGPASGKADYGASICALNRLAQRKGYRLVGCGLYSANGFYVSSRLVQGRWPWSPPRFEQPLDPARFFNPLRYEMIVNFPFGRDIWPDIITSPKRAIRP